jgi:hypothetical protein
VFHGATIDTASASVDAQSFAGGGAREESSPTRLLTSHGATRPTWRPPFRNLCFGQLAPGWQIVRGALDRSALGVRRAAC